MDNELVNVLRQTGERNVQVLDMDFSGCKPLVLDFSPQNRELDHLDTGDVQAFNRYVFDKLRQQDTPLGIGRYDEDRVVYRHSTLFDGEQEARSIHLGIDLFAAPGTGVKAPMTARVHSFADNAEQGNYGPAIILEHKEEGLSFFTLYGHLARESLDGLYPGREITAGEVFARIGDVHENGGWPPHLHFQVIADMGEYKGDFPGVASPAQRREYLALCPDPNLLLRIPGI